MQNKSNSWPYHFARLVVLATLCLIFLGGMVTTKRAGLAVPDWPLSFGSLNPHGWWMMTDAQGEHLVRLEHVHRLFAELVGLLTIALAVGVWRTDERSWVKWLSLGAVLGVILQGVLGGLRVIKLSI